jgi:hypothetical protein
MSFDKVEQTTAHIVGRRDDSFVTRTTERPASRPIARPISRPLSRPATTSTATSQVARPRNAAPQH